MLCYYSFSDIFIPICAAFSHTIDAKSSYLLGQPSYLLGQPSYLLGQKDCLHINFGIGFCGGFGNGNGNGDG